MPVKKEEEGKTDMDKMGLFREMGYLHGKKYVWAKQTFNESAYKGRQIMTPCSKLKAANQDGYFEEVFARIFEGEAYYDLVRRRRLDRLEAERLKIVPKAFKPPPYPKKIHGSGEYYGTFCGVIEAFSPVEVEEPPPRPVGRNVITNPGKKGGYGYLHICINPYPLHLLPEQEEFLESNEPEEVIETPIKKPLYLGMHPKEYFDEHAIYSDLPTYLIVETERFTGIPFITVCIGKKLGGCKAGCFSKFPEHMPEPYKPYVYSRGPVDVRNDSNDVFTPVPGPKFRLLPIKSIVYQNLDRVVNQTNYETVKTTIFDKPKKPPSAKRLKKIGGKPRRSKK